MRKPAEIPSPIPLLPMLPAPRPLPRALHLNFVPIFTVSGRASRHTLSNDSLSNVYRAARRRDPGINNTSERG